MTWYTILHKRLAQCRFVHTPMSTPAKDYPRLIRAYWLDILPQHTPLQVCAQAVRADHSHYSEKERKTLARCRVVCTPMGSPLQVDP